MVSQIEPNPSMLGARIRPPAPSNVLPYLPDNDGLNGVNAYTVLSSKHFPGYESRSVSLPYCNHICDRQPCHSVPLPSRYDFRSKPKRMIVAARHPIPMGTRRIAIASQRSPLCHHVSHVVGVCAEEEMARPNTRRVVASMEDLHSGRNGANKGSIGETVCSYFVALRVKSPVSVCKRPLPDPARIGLLNASPKAIDLGDRCKCSVWFATGDRHG